MPLKLRQLMQYVRIEYKCMILTLLRSAVSFIVMGIILGGTAYAGMYLLNEQSMYEPVRIAVASADDDSGYKWIIRLVGSMDSIKSICSLEQTDEAGAYEGVANGDYEGAVILPERFLNSLYTRGNLPARVLLPTGQLLGSDLFADLLYSGVSMIDSAEYVIYSVYDSIVSSGDEAVAAAADDTLTRLFADEVLNRGAWFEEATYGPYGPASTADYYGSVFVVMILMFSGLYFGHMYSDGFRSAESKLAGCGIGRGYTTSVRVAVIFSALMVIGTLSDLIFRQILNLAGAVSSSYKGIRILYTVPVCLLISLFHDLIYRAAREAHRARMILLAAGILAVVAGGFFVPVSYMPGLCRIIASTLPVNICGRYLMQGCSYSPDMGTCAGLAAYIVILIIGGIFVRCEK